MPRPRALAATRCRLVLPLLPRPCARARSRCVAVRDPAAGSRLVRRSRVGWASDAVPLRRPRATHRQPDQLHRKPVLARGGLRGSRALHRPPSRSRGLHGHRRRSHVRVARRRCNQRRRVLGVAQHRVPFAPARVVRRCRQRLRDLGARRRPVARADLRVGARLSWAARREDGRARLLPGAHEGSERGRTCARRRGPGARARNGHAALLTLAVGRPEEVPVARRARRRAGARPDRVARTQARASRRADEARLRTVARGDTRRSAHRRRARPRGAPARSRECARPRPRDHQPKPLGARAAGGRE